MKVWVVWTGTEPDVYLDGIYASEKGAKARVAVLSAKGREAWSAEVEVKP